MAGRKGGHSAPKTPWDQAVALARGEDRLIQGVKRKTWEHWRRTGVPEHHMMKFRGLALREMPVAYRPSRRKATPVAAPALDDLAREMLLQRSAIEALMEQGKEQHAALMNLLEALRLSFDRQRGERLRRGSEAAGAG